MNGTPGDARRRARREILGLALITVAAATQLPDGGWNGSAHFALVQSLADGTPRIDRHLNQSGDIAYTDGHFYAAKAPGLALFSLPVYAVVDALGKIPQGAPTSPPPGARYVTGRTMWNVNLVVIAAFFALLLLIRQTVNRLVESAGAPIAVMLGLGTLLLPFATAYFAHVLAAALGFTSFAVASRKRSGRSYAELAVAGLLAGLATVVEFPCVIVAAAVGLYVLAERGARLQRIGSYTAGFVAGIVPLLAFNTWALGSPFRTSYADAVAGLGKSGHDVLGANSSGFFGLTYPHLHPLSELLISERGLFVLTPITVVALAGLPGLALRGLRREACLVAGLTVTLLLYNASYYLPFGGNTPGPRFLVILLPFLALPLAEAWIRWPKTTVVVAAASAFWMVAATIAQPLLPGYYRPTIWISRIVHDTNLTGSILFKGWSGAALFVMPALAGIALACSHQPNDDRRSRR